MHHVFALMCLLAEASPSRFLLLTLITCAAAAPQWFPHPVAPFSPYGLMPYGLQHAARVEMPAEGRFLTTSTVSHSGLFWY